jgi:chondroitin AC lyase
MSVFLAVGTVQAVEPSVLYPDQIIERYRTLLCSGKPPKIESVQHFADRISATGTWPDIDYAGRSRAGWQPAEHLSRVRLMSFALAAQEHRQEDYEKLRRAIRLALDNWFTKRYRASNWWWNEIGVPRTMRDIVVLLGNNLKDDRRNAAIEMIGQYKLAGSGANLMWSAELYLHHSCLTGNREQIARAAQRIWREIKISDSEGIQRDWSFYQHGPRLQTFHYGKSYLEVACMIGWQLRQTPWAVPKEKRAIISSYFLEGAQWMCRGTYTVPGTLDRAVSRKGSLRKADLRHLLRLWREVDPKHREEFDALIARQEGDGPPLVGYRHFPQADFTAYHRPTASVFLKTVSSRTLLTESINFENLKGVRYLNCGDHYILRDGREYRDLQPVWQWEHLPGLTTLQGDLKQQRMPFVGGVGNGRSGLTAMDYTRCGSDGAVLSIRKTWFFHDDLVICLIGGTKGGKLSGNIVSSMEQCWLRGSVTARIGTEKVMEIETGSHYFDNAHWLLHNNIGYVPLNQAGLKVFLGERAGTWHSINRRYEKDKVREPVFQILLDHEKAPKSQGWLVVLSATGQELDAIVNKPIWKIIQNDRDCQSIRFTDGLQMASFYGPGSAGIREAEVTVDQPCLAMWSEDRLWLCDPTMKGRDISVSWKQRKYAVRLPEEGKIEQTAPEDADKPRR